MNYLGVDTGKHGAICLLESGAPRWWAIPKRDGDVDLEALGGIVFGLPAIRLAMVEKPPRSMGRAGSFAQWETGRSWGNWEALMALSRIPWCDWSPSSWQSAAGVSLPRGFQVDGRKASQQERRAELGRRCVAKAQALYPGADLTWPGGYVPSVDKAVALLLAELAKRRG